MQHRFPGAHPFNENQSSIFFGRKNEIEELHDFLSLEKVSVLYGKSGLGKSSLVYAGLLEYIKLKQQFIPITIRLGTEEPLEDVRNAIDRFKLSANKKLEKVLTDDNSLWYLLKHKCIDAAGEKDIILIFDQFEELFNFEKKYVDNFCKQLAEVLYTTIPQRFRVQIVKLLDEGKSNDEYINAIHQELNLKLLFVIRSDKVSFLNNLKDYIPNILKSCYELLPLSLENARSAILGPAQRDGNFISPKFDLETDLLDQILNYLSQADDNSVEANHLQIICQHLEETVIQKNISRIRVSDVDNLKSVYQDYYENQLAKLNSETDIRKSRKLIEEGLILFSEKRRLRLYEGQIKEDYKVNRELLSQLVAFRIIRAESDSRGGYIYEISHDSLVKPILELRAEREKIEGERLREEELERLAAENEKERKRIEHIKGLNLIAKKRLNIAIVFVVLSVLSTIALIIFYRNANTAYENERETKTNSLLGFAELNKEQNPTLSFRLAEHALKVNPNSEIAQKTILATYNNSSTVQFYNTFLTKKDDNIIELSLSEDEEYVAAATEDHRILLFEVNDTDRLPIEINTKHKDNITAISFSPSGKYLLVASKDGSATVWDLSNNYKKVTHLKGHDEQVNSISMSPNESYIVTAADDFKIKIWNIKGENIFTDGSHIAEVTQARFINNVQLYSHSIDHTIKVFGFDSELRLLREERSSGDRGNYLVSVEFDKTDNLIIAAFESGKIYLVKTNSTGWANDPTTRETYSNLGYKISLASFSPQKNIIVAVTNENQIIVFDRNTGNVINKFQGHQADIVKLKFSSDGNYFITTSIDNTVKLWNAKGNLVQILADHKNYFTPIIFSKTNDYFITASEQEIRLWQFKKKRTIILENQDSTLINTANFYKKENVLTASSNGEVNVFDFSGNLLDDLVQPDGIPSQLVISPTHPDTRENYKDFFLLTKDSKVFVYNNDELVKSFEHQDRGRITAAEFNFNGNYVISSSAKGSVYLWRTNASNTKFYLKSKFNTKGVTGVNFIGKKKGEFYYTVLTPDNRILLLEPTAEPITGVREEHNKRFIKQIVKDHIAEITVVHFSDDQKMMLTASEDRTINIYTLENKLSSTPIKKVRSLIGHLDGVKYAAFSNDKKYVISCSDDQTIKIWSLENGSIVLSLEQVDANVNFVEMSPNNDFILIGSTLGNVKLKPIELDVDKVLEEINVNKVYGKVRDLTHDEKEAYGIYQ